MTIVPIMPISSLEELQKVSQSGGVSAASSAGNPFKSMFEDAVNNVKEADVLVNNAVTQAASGEADDLHNLSIASTKMSLAVDLFIQLRNKSLDAYNEIMRMGV